MEAILCDQCNNNLTYSSGGRSTRLGLTSKALEVEGGGWQIANSMEHMPDRHFCNMQCLKEFVTKEKK